MTKRRAMLCAVLAALVAAAVYAHSLDSTLHHPPPSHLLLDRRGAYLGEVASADEMLGYWQLPEVLPEKIAAATLHTEDRAFYQHPGVHLPSAARALWQNTRNLDVISGASTIAMQVARLQHPSRRTLWAKAREAGEALLLIRAHGHDLVLRQYLTIAPYGNRTHGVVRAARLYFDKPVEDLSWQQAAFLAALPQQPGRMNPYDTAGRARAMRRTNRILRALHERGVIDAETLRIALASDLQLQPKPRRHADAMHVVMQFAREANRLPDITTSTVDLELQHLAARALSDQVKSLHWASVGTGATLVVDLPSGEVLARIGSHDYFDADDRGAIDFTTVRRSPGSALKPFIYGLALERGIATAATELPDTPIEFPLVNGSTWVPENINHSFLGPMLFRSALGNSRNIPALRLLSDVGVDRTVQLLERGGVKELDHTPGAYGLTLAIGGLQVTAEEVAVLYTALANQGSTVPLTSYLGRTPASGNRLLSPDAALMIRHVLSDSTARRPGFPAGSALDFDYAVAVKTGTSQSYRDVWAVGFSDRLLVVTWLGNHDLRRTNRLSGAAAAAPVVHRILDEAMPLRAAHREVTLSFAPPPGWLGHEVCSLSGRLAGTACTNHHTEYFAPGTAPTESCPFHAPVPLDARNGLLATTNCPAQYVVKKQLLALPERYASWARREKLDIAPTRVSPLCPLGDETPAVAIDEPQHRSRYLFDPDTPRELSTVRLAAHVTPATEEIVWLVDGTPVGTVGWPHELRTSLSPGTHTIRAAFANRALKSQAITVVVDD